MCHPNVMIHILSVFFIIIHCMATYMCHHPWSFWPPTHHMASTNDYCLQPIYAGYVSLVGGQFCVRTEEIHSKDNDWEFLLLI
jgi:hypothetical protein